ncbi:hypothetical protein RI543_001172 [Arxiozyma heterogenica]|uniref:B30.2/SPRY domain-containing protein n=1 Tax=Arxiozyma heterogenica TaxID=278026 RepID=A0AAN8A953_9SACH|nr:hypothetical protein RI543_001172 [Kazachstania heterogenica]
MTDFMNPIDKEYINSLFPAYLLKQPIGYDLLNCYYINKKLFQKLHEKRSLESTIQKDDIEDDATPNTAINNNKINLSGFHLMYKNGKNSDQLLSADLKKDIWSNLMSLGVLGTIPFDSVNDDYLIQIYQYFYPNDIRVTFNNNNNSIINNNRSINIPDSRNISSTSPEFITTDIYSTIGYTLPTRWLSQRNDRIIISNDQFSKLSINSNWERPLTIGSKATVSSFSYNRNRLRNTAINISGDNNNNNNNDSNKERRNRSLNSMSDYIMTWSNNTIPASKVAIFYYEIKIIDVSSTENGKNCNIIVGFKYSNYPNNNSNSNNNNPAMIGSTNFNNNNNCNIYEQLNPSFIVGSNTRSGHTIRNRNRERRRRRNRLRRNQSSGRRTSSTTIGSNTTPSGININRDTSVSGNNHGNENDTDDDINMSDNNNDDNDDNSEDDGNSGSDYNDDGDLDITTTAHHRNNSNIRASLEATNSFIISNSKQFHGIDDTFFGYHGFDGKAFSILESETFAKPFGINDVIGCGINYINGTIFFTKNGNFLGTAFSEFHDIDLVPAIALKAGNSIQTNFGLFEEFTFDILGYQNKWKQRAYDHIFNSVDVKHGYSIIPESGSDINSVDIDQGELLFLLGKDRRISEKDGSMYKIQPNYVPINKLNPEDESISPTLNCLINGYLIHEGLIDVAKGFLKDLKDEIETETELDQQSKTLCNTSNNNNNNFNIGIQRQILKYNEEQIFKEEKLLHIRQELKKLINSSEIDKCIEYIRTQIPGFLEFNIEALFELKLVRFLINIKKNSSNVENLIHEGQSLIEEFVYQNHEILSNSNIKINKELKEIFQSRINSAASLLAYNSPLIEAPEDLLMMLSREFIQDRLFLMLNSNILLYLNKTDECALENIVGYTRTMFSTMRQYHLEGDQSYSIDPDLNFQMPQEYEYLTKEKKNEVNTMEKNIESIKNSTCLETRYYKIINLDEDILSMN